MREQSRQHRDGDPRPPMEPEQDGSLADPLRPLFRPPDRRQPQRTGQCHDVSCPVS